MSWDSKPLIALTNVLHLDLESDDAMTLRSDGSYLGRVERHGH